MAMWVRRLFLLAFLLALALPAASQTQQPNSSGGVIKNCTELVVLDAQVRRRSGETVGTLSREDFTIYEDGIKQQIVHFSKDQPPLSIVLLLDVSGSVVPVFEQIQDGGSRALQRLKDEDEVALMSFGTEAVLIQDFTRDRQRIVNWIANKAEFFAAVSKNQRLPPDGTHIADSIYFASKHLLTASNPAGRRVIVMVTDDQPAESWTLHSKEEIRNALFETGALVYGLLTETVCKSCTVTEAIVRYYPPMWLGRKLKLFRDTSRNIGGKVGTYAEPPGGAVIDARKQKLETKLTELIEILRNRYSLDYYPSNREFDGKLRRITLKVSPEVEKRDCDQHEERLHRTRVSGPARQPASDTSYAQNLLTSEAGWRKSDKW